MIYTTLKQRSSIIAVAILMAASGCSNPSLKSGRASYQNGNWDDARQQLQLGLGRKKSIADSHLLASTNQMIALRALDSALQSVENDNMGEAIAGLQQTIALDGVPASTLRVLLIDLEAQYNAANAAIEEGLALKEEARHIEAYRKLSLALEIASTDERVDSSLLDIRQAAVDQSELTYNDAFIREEYDRCLGTVADFAAFSTLDRQCATRLDTSLRGLQVIELTTESEKMLGALAHARAYELAKEATRLMENSTLANTTFRLASEGYASTFIAASQGAAEKAAEYDSRPDAFLRLREVRKAHALAEWDSKIQSAMDDCNKLVREFIERDINRLKASVTVETLPALAAIHNFRRELLTPDELRQDRVSPGLQEAAHRLSQLYISIPPKGNGQNLHMAERLYAHLAATRTFNVIVSNDDPEQIRSQQEQAAATLLRPTGIQPASITPRLFNYELKLGNPVYTETPETREPNSVEVFTRYNRPDNQVRATSITAHQQLQQDIDRLHTEHTVLTKDYEAKYRQLVEDRNLEKAAVDVVSDLEKLQRLQQAVVTSLRENQATAVDLARLTAPADTATRTIATAVQAEKVELQNAQRRRGEAEAIEAQAKGVLETHRTNLKDTESRAMAEVVTINSNFKTALIPVIENAEVTAKVISRKMELPVEVILKSERGDETPLLAKFNITSTHADEVRTGAPRLSITPNGNDEELIPTRQELDFAFASGASLHAGNLLHQAIIERMRMDILIAGTKAEEQRIAPVERYRLLTQETRAEKISVHGPALYLDPSDHERIAQQLNEAIGAMKAAPKLGAGEVASGPASN